MEDVGAGVVVLPAEWAWDVREGVRSDVVEVVVGDLVEPLEVFQGLVQVRVHSL